MIVLGLGFGDEGKGATTSFLCSITKDPIVVRFNGGHQAGHTVVHKDKRHVFSSFGSGTMQGVPTYWSEYCVFSPVAFKNEALKLNMDLPKYFIHPMSPVSTPYDIMHNRDLNSRTNHGTCGVGFGSTIDRHEKRIKLHAMDLFNDRVLIERLRGIQNYYKSLGYEANIDITEFIHSIDFVKSKVTLYVGIPNGFNPIFEGAQGIMLDQDFGFFPHVTRSNTTSRNVRSLSPRDIAINYVTRTYQTRHGNGPMTNTELPPPELKNNEHETNVTNPYQGEFRKTILDIDLLRYAIDCNSMVHPFAYETNLFITCADQTEKLLVTVGGEPVECGVKSIPKYIGRYFRNVYVSYEEGKFKII